MTLDRGVTTSCWPSAGLLFSRLRSGTPVCPRVQACRPWTTASSMDPRRRGVTAVGVIWALGALHIMPTGHVGIVERFGEPVSQTDGAGLSLRWPPPIETMTVVDVGAEQRLDLNAQTLLTGDQSMVSLEAVLHYSVSDVDAFAYGTHAPVETLKTLAEARFSGRRPLNQDVLLTTGRFDTEGRVLRALQAAVDESTLASSVSAVHLTNVAVPPPVVARPRCHHSRRGASDRHQPGRGLCGGRDPACARRGAPASSVLKAMPVGSQRRRSATTSGSAHCIEIQSARWN